LLFYIIYDTHHYRQWKPVPLPVGTRKREKHLALVKSFVA
jgi:hypothetical protein